MRLAQATGSEASSDGCSPHWMLLGTASSAQSILCFGMDSLATNCWSVLAGVSGEGDKP